MDDEDRLLIRDGFRHYRRRYSLTEVRWGLVTLGLMGALTAWVVWKGSHPVDPDLFSDGTALLKPADGTSSLPAPAPARVAPAVDRGPLPPNLAGAGWHEDKMTQFDADNLYVKIDGRADYFKSFGFRRLYGVLLVSDKDPATTVDVELYDLGAVANALGAYGGERAPGISPQVTDSGLQHVDRNALYLARGPYYIRVIGSDETTAVTQKLQVLGEALTAGVKGESLPWAFALFVGQMGIDPGKIAYFAENAFSQAAGRDVWTVRPGGNSDDLEVFVIARNSAADAAKLATKLRAGFLEMGEPIGASLVKDRFLGTLAAVRSTERWVIGVHGAADDSVVTRELGRLKDAFSKASPELKQRARPAVVPSKKGDNGDH